jgi:hypothetical protein
VIGLLKENKLFLHLEGSLDKPLPEDDLELRPQSCTGLFYGDRTDRQIEFETAATGRPVNVWQITRGVSKEAAKIE